MTAATPHAGRDILGARAPSAADDTVPAQDALTVTPLPALHLEDGPEAMAVRGLLRLLQRVLQDHILGSPPTVVPLVDLPVDVRTALLESLGRGEVHLRVEGTRVYDIVETALCGVWLVQGGNGAETYLEVADVPSAVRAANAQGTRAAMVMPAQAPPGAMNVMPVLQEVAYHQAAWQPQQPTHTISFTLLPMNDVDMPFLKATLGVGPVQAESGGYGTCRVALTGLRNVWSVQFLSAMGNVILDTLEIGDVPVALCAARQDLEDSAARLEELL